MRFFISFFVLLGFVVTPSLLFAESVATPRSPLTLWGSVAPHAQESDVRDLIMRLLDWSAHSGSTLAYWRAAMLAEKSGLADLIPPPSVSHGRAAHPLAEAALPDLSSEFFFTLLPRSADHAYALMHAPRSAGDAFADPPLAIPISALVPITIAPVPLTQVTQAPDALLPPILHLAPADRFVLYAPRLSALDALAMKADTLTGTALLPWTTLSSSLLQEQLFTRLGINDRKGLEDIAGATILVADDPTSLRTGDIALLVETDANSDAIGRVLSVTAPPPKRVDGYVIFATSEKLTGAITATAAGIPDFPALSDQEDAKSILGSRTTAKDIFAFFSKRAVERLLSPAEVIASYRQAKAASRLDALQYAALSYRSITGEWPTATSTPFAYLAPSSPGYVISADGIVSHPIWGSLYDFHPNSQAPIALVSAEEAELYEKIRAERSLAWGAFASGALVFTNGELEMFSVLLPHGVDHPDIAALNEIFGGPARALDPTAPLPASYALLLRGVLDPEHLLLSPQYAPYLRVSESPGTPLWDGAATASKEETRRRLSAEFRNAVSVFGSDMVADPYTLLGGDMFVGVAQNASYATDLSALDGILSLATEDGSNFARFLVSLYAGIVRTISRAGEIHVPSVVRYEDVDTALFILPGQEYYGLFTKTRAYITRQKKSAADAFDGLRKGGVPGELSPVQKELASRVGTTGNMLLLLDLGGLNSYKDGMITDDSGWWGAPLSTRIAHILGYLGDAQGVALMLGDGHLVDRYVPHIPRDIGGFPVSFDAETLGVGELRMRSDGKPAQIALTNVYGKKGEKMTREDLAHLVGIGALVLFDGTGVSVKTALLSAETKISPAREGGSWSRLRIVLTLIAGLFGLLLLFGIYRLTRFVVEKKKKDRTVAEVMAETIERIPGNFGPPR